MCSFFQISIEIRSSAAFNAGSESEFDNHGLLYAWDDRLRFTYKSQGQPHTESPRNVFFILLLVYGMYRFHMRIPKRIQK